MMHPWRGAVGILLAAGVAASPACWRGRNAARRTSEMPGDALAVRLDVSNNYALPMQLFVVGSGVSFRLGTVDPGMRAQFVVPQSATSGGPVEFVALPAAADTTSRERASSGRLVLEPGQIVDFAIHARLFNSTAVIRQ